MNVHALQQWLLHFGKASHILQQASSEMMDWLANIFPPWALYRPSWQGTW
jgi:hypothetical protein